MTRLAICSHGRTDSAPWNSVHVWPMSIHCTAECPHPRAHGQHNGSFLLLREGLKFKFSPLTFQAGKGWKCCLFSWFPSGLFGVSLLAVGFLWMWSCFGCDILLPAYRNEVQRVSSGSESSTVTVLVIEKQLIVLKQKWYGSISRQWVRS